MANVQLKCPCCGGALQFDDKKQLTVCPYCDSEFTAQDLKAYTDELANAPEEDTSWDESMVQAFTGEDKKGIKIYSCDSCGGEIIVEETTASTICPYCGNNLLVAKELKGDLKPNYVIPFKLDKDETMASLKKFFKKKPLLPGSFKKDNVIEEIKPLYVPFWLFDADVSGQVRFKGETTRRWSDSNYDYKETKYYSIFRGGQIAFDHVPVDGSKKMEDKLMESIEPYDFDEAQDFNAAFLAGIGADRYDVSKDETFNRATIRFRDGTVQAFRGDISGYENVTVQESSLQFSNTNACYALYPVWILNTKWKEKSFLFAINGQTGKVAGNLPISGLKFFLFWMLFFAVGVGLGALLGLLIESIWIGLLIGAVVGIIMATAILLGMRKKNKNVQFQYGAANYVRPNTFNIDYRKSLFLYSKVTKTKRASSDNK